MVCRQHTPWIDYTASLTGRVVADSFAGRRRPGAGRQALGGAPAGRGRAERRGAGRRQRQRGKRRDRDAEDAADRVAGGRGRRRADERGRRRRRETARRLRGLLRRLTVMVMMVMMMMLRRHRLLGLLGRLVAHDPTHARRTHRTQRFSASEYRVIIK